MNIRPGVKSGASAELTSVLPDREIGTESCHTTRFSAETALKLRGRVGSLSASSMLLDRILPNLHRNKGHVIVPQHMIRVLIQCIEHGRL